MTVNEPFQIVSDDGAVWGGDGTLTFRGTTYGVEFHADGCDGPCLYLVLPLATPVKFRATLEACGCNWATFALGDEFVCGGTAAPGGPCANRILIRVEWKCCNPIEGFDGAGWYCVKPAGRVAGCHVVELPEDAACDRTIEICSGPYVSEAAAEAVCSTYVDCGDRRYARYYTFTLSGLTGNVCTTADCQKLNDRVNIVQFSTSGGNCPWRGELPAAAFPSDCFSGAALAWNFRSGVSPGIVMELILTIGSTNAYWSSTDLTWTGDTPLVLTGGGTGTGTVRCVGYPTTITVYPDL